MAYLLTIGSRGRHKALCQPKKLWYLWVPNFTIYLGRFINWNYKGHDCTYFRYLWDHTTTYYEFIHVKTFFWLRPFLYSRRKLNNCDDLWLQPSSITYITTCSICEMGNSRAVLLKLMAFSRWKQGIYWFFRREF